MKCIFCGSNCEISRVPMRHSANEYKCKYCGTYLIDEFLLKCDPLISDKNNKYKIACVLNERRLKRLSGIVISNKTDKENKIRGYPEISTEDILKEFPKKASDYFNRILLNLSRLPERPFEEINLNIYDESADRLNLFAFDKIGCETIIMELVDQGLIKHERGELDIRILYLTTKFWEIVENLQQTSIDSDRVFVAMWFDESMNDYYHNGIEKAIKDTGYIPVRIDSKDFLGKICDEIIAEIKRCKFLISDFSGQRGGVYYEAGFAHGLGRQVIFTVKKDDVKNLHFDTRQYNHIVYDSPDDLYKKLYNRICATII